jgi:hypothetical protein
MTEAQLQTAVIELARLLGWRVAHFRPALTARGWRTAVEGDGAGFPDLVLARPRRLLFVELKGPKGLLATAQVDWMNALLGAGAEYHCWWPFEWTDGTVERILR